MSTPAQQLARLVKESRWYHQGFDATPLLLSVIGEGEVAMEPRKPAGMAGTRAICFFAHGHADWYFDQQDLDRGVDVMIALAQQNPHIGADIRAKWVGDERVFEELYADFDPAVLPTLSVNALLALYHRYHDAAVLRYTSTSVIDHFTLASDRLLADMIRKECGPFASESEFSTLFSALTAPVFRSFIHDAELALLELAISETPGGIERYRKQFFWKRNNYVASYQLSHDDVLTELADVRAAKPDLAAAREELLSAPGVAAHRKAELIAQYHLSPLLQSLIALSDLWCQWQDERKRATFISTYIFDAFLQEFARRGTTDHELLKYLLPTEVEAFVRGVEPTSVTLEQLKQRVQLCAVVYSLEGMAVYTGDEATQLHDGMEQSQQAHAPVLLRGLVANTGVATGKVRILTSATEVGTMQQGEVLVAIMTRPDYVSAMKKAAAIVTDEGGVTCHAAILSRELGIPCIIGTQNATIQLRTGDMVCVDANTNSISIL